MEVTKATKYFVLIETVYGRVVEEVASLAKARGLFKEAVAYGHIAAVCTEEGA